MIIYAFDSTRVEHPSALKWWEDLVNSEETLLMPWATSLAVIRTLTNPKITKNPAPIAKAVSLVDWILQLPQVAILEPGSGHLFMIATLLNQAQRVGNVVTDAHLAAIAIEHRATIHTNDSDFRRFPGVKLHYPLVVGR